MKLVVLLVTMMIAGSASAFFDLEGSKTFTGGGKWKTSEGYKGAYKQSLSFTKTSRGDEAQVLELDSRLKVLDAEGEIVSEENDVISWKFIGRGYFKILRGDALIGRGQCTKDRGCSYQIRDRETREVSQENLRWHKEKKALIQKGAWRSEESSGRYRGILKFVPAGE